MKNEFVKNIKILSVAIMLAAGILTVSAWVGPGAIPPNSNSSSAINISGTSQTKPGSLWASSFLTAGGGYFGGNLGIGTNNPQGSLHVSSGSCYYKFSSDGLHTNCPVVSVTNLVISSDTANYNIATALGNPITPKGVILTINSGVKVYSTSTSQPALDTGTLPAGSTIKIVNNGYIVGLGGDGGRGGGVWSGGCCWNQWVDSARSGTAGGNALELRLPVTIDNTNGNIWGGGGGGGGGAGAMMWSMVRTGGGGGGGAGGGLGNTDVNGMTCNGNNTDQYSCGSGNYCTARAGAGSNGGIITGAGAGGAGTSGGNAAASESCDENGNCSCSVGAGGNGASGSGGTGGDYGQPGNTGGSSSIWGWCGCSGDNYSQGGGAGGGAAGKAIITNSQSVTWLGGNNGTQVKGAVQ